MLRIFAIILTLLSFCSCADNQLVIGIAWRDNVSGSSYIGTYNAIEAIGAKPVFLGQVRSTDLRYSEGKIDTAHLDDTGVGIVYASLKDDFYSALNKKIICRLFKEKEYSDEMFEKYLEWIEENPAVDKNDVIDTFAKYSLLEDEV